MSDAVDQALAEEARTQQQPFTCFKCGDGNTANKGLPRRVQRKRLRGWKMPPNTVSVCRPSKWENPLVVGSDGILGRRDAEVAVALFERELRHALDYIPYHPDRRTKFQQMAADLHELRGKNLACFCPLDQPCHADVLLYLANEKE